jgi:hypothetical protein
MQCKIMMNKNLFIFDSIRIIVNLFVSEVEVRIQSMNKSLNLTNKIYKEVK